MDDAHKIHRLLATLTYIQSGGGWNAQRLAQEFNVTERTVYRDIRDLEDAGVPVHFDRGRAGYRVRGSFFLPPVELDAEEALSLVVLCEELAGREQIAFLSSALRAITKVRAHLPASVQDEIDRLSSLIHVQTAQTGEHDDHRDVYERVRAAIAQRRALLCRYEGLSSGDDGEFHFEPYTLYFGTRAWYAIGRHSAREDVRTLRLSRFVKAVMSDHRYDIPGDFSLQNHFGHAWRMIRGEPRYDVEIEFDAEFAQTMSETRWHHTQRIDHRDDGGAVFRCTVDGLDEIVWWVLSMGPHCRVVKPVELADRVRTLAAETARQYGSVFG